MTLLTAIIIAIFGAAVGSFLSVVIFRVHNNKKGIFFGKSICPYCNKPLKWRHLIPIVSFLFLKGKCAYCGKRIGKHYFMLELLTALVFVLTFLSWNFLIPIASSTDPSLILHSIDWKIFEIFAFYILEMGLLMTIFFYDLLYKEIPDRFSLPAIALGILAVFLFGVPTLPSLVSIGMGLLIIAVFFGGQILLSKGAWLGGGDLRIGILMAVLLGWESMVLALIVGYVLGALVSIVLLFGKKADRKTAIPFGPFLITGLLVALFLGEKIINFYLKTLGI